MARKSVEDRNKELKPFGKQLKLYGLVLSILPTQKQIDLFCQTFGCSRLAFNMCLAKRQEHYDTTGESLSTDKYKTKHLNPLKKTDDFLFLKNVDKFALETAVENVEDAYSRFFKGQNRYPKFKSKRKAKKAYTTKFTDTTAGGNIRFIDESYIKIPKAGDVKYIKPKTKDNSDKFEKIFSGEASIKKATISERAGKFYISLACEEIIDLVNPIEMNNIDLSKVCAIDLGLKDFATIYNGEESIKVANPKYFVKYEAKLAKLQKKFARMKKDSKNWNKVKFKIAKLHKKIADSRANHAHQLSRKLVNENQVVIVENLNIRGMVKNKNLAKSISDAGWSQFLTFLKYKLAWEGKHYIEVDRWFASSKICSSCGEKKVMLKLSEREWVCSCCATHHDRDENASINIRKEGMRILGLA